MVGSIELVKFRISETKEKILTVRIEAIRILNTLFPIRYIKLSLMILSVLNSLLIKASSSRLND